MKRPKVLILYNRIFHYRVPIWNLLSEKCDLTITYCDGGLPDNIQCKFKTIFIPYKKIGPFTWHKTNIRKMAKNYDAVIAYGDVTWLKYSLLPWFSNIKVAFWTIGVSTSGGYDKKNRKDFISHFIYKKAKALIFYSEEPIKKYLRLGFKKECLFVANNTVEVIETPLSKHKDYIAFIGTLRKRKGLDLLLESYYYLKDKYPLPKLVIVGNGPEYSNIKNWIDENKMQNLIELKGAVIDPNGKANILNNAIACISPRQAGLSVLECMGYGVPFVTTKDAITGGERFNIHNNIDGIVMDDESQLNDILIEIVENPSKYVDMGKKAKEYYINNRTPQQMVDGLWETIRYLISE